VAAQMIVVEDALTVSGADVGGYFLERLHAR
jgi:hypothetical protein